jgi:hypothetical protein
MSTNGVLSFVSLDSSYVGERVCRVITIRSDINRITVTHMFIRLMLRKHKRAACIPVWWGGGCLYPANPKLLPAKKYRNETRQQKLTKRSPYKGGFTHTMPFPCCSHAVPMPFPCRSHAVPLPFPCRSHAVPMPFPCRSPAVPMPFPCRSHAVPLPFPYNAVFLRL